MKRKLNESLTFPVKIDVVRLVNENPELNGQVDKLATQIEDTTDATITKEEADGTVYMVIDGLTQDQIIDIFENDYYIDDVDNFFVYDDADNELDDVESDDDARAAAEDDMRDEYGDDYIDENYGLDDEGEWIDIDDEDDYDDMIPDYDEVDIDNPDALDARDAAYADMEDDDDMYDETYEDADDEFADEDSLNDSDDEFDECIEDSEFECYESVNDRKLRKNLHEKKRGCCPPKKGKRLVNLSEALKMRKNGLTTKDIVRSAKKPYLNESIINNAINKAKEEPRNDKKLKLIMKKKEIIQLKESLGSEKFNMICEAMKSGKKTLYSKKTINGKNITEYSSKELLELLNTVKKQHTNLMKSYKSLNESATKSTKRELRTAIENKERLMLILDEELTYRLTFKKLNKINENKSVNEDEENPLEPLPVDPNGGDDSESTDDNADGDNVDSLEDTDSSEDSDDAPDTDEEVELSRVVITVANQDAADELKQSLVDAGVPDDAIEFETDDDTSDDSEDSDTDTDSEADTENNDSDENTDETSNESLHYNKFKKLLEDENSESDTSDSTDVDDGEDSDVSADDDTDDSSDNEDKPIKVVLTNTDYVNDLADVLNNEYGISKEEFEDMIGGQIVDDSDNSDDSTDADSSDDSTDSDDKSDDENKEDKPSTNGDDAVDAMSQEELDKLFGGN